MSPPVWAYQVDNFCPPPDDELVCSICQAIFCDPVQSPCQHVFCRACIAKWLETSRNCPICRKRTSRSTLHEVVPIVKNMIMKLVLRCHNSERGCRAQFTLESCEGHVRECPYELVTCKNRPCKVMLARGDVGEHEASSCLHSYVRCEHCNVKVSSYSTTDHDCIKELKLKLKEKDKKLRVYREKLKKLKEELKNMRESEDFTSDSSIASAAEILFNFTENSNLSEFSSMSSDDTVNLQSSADESETAWSGPTRESMISELEQLQERINDHFVQMRSANNEEEASIEYPRASSTASFNDSSVLVSEPVSNFFEEPGDIVRPPKRRLVTQLLDSSDEEEHLGEVILPSRKRTLPPQGDVAAESVAGPSGGLPSVDSSRRRSPNRLKSAERRSGNPVFERTLSLLEQYNFESDPEWLPTEARVEFSSSSESESSYEDATEARAGDLLNSFYGSSSDSDEWIPPPYQ